MADQDIVIQIQTDMAQFHKDMADVKKELRLTGQETDKTNKRLKALGKGLEQIAIVAAAASAAVSAFGIAQFNAARETTLWANRLGIARAEFAKFAAIGKKFGATIDDVGDSMKDLNERIADAALGNKTYEEALNKIGLSSKRLINLSLDEQFLKVADAIGKLNNVGDQNFVTAELMADAGFRLLPVFRQGEEAIRNMGASLARTNKAMSEETLDLFSQLEQQMIGLWSEVDALGNKMGWFVGLMRDAAEGAKFLAHDLNAIFETDKDEAAERLKEIQTEMAQLNKQLEHYEKGLGGSFFTSAESLAEKTKKRIVELTKEAKEMRAIMTETGLVYGAAMPPDGFGKRSQAAIPDTAQDQLLQFMLYGGSAAGQAEANSKSEAITGATDGVGPAIYPMPEEQKAIQDLLLENMLDYQENEFVYKAEHNARMAEQHQSFRDWLFQIDEKAEKATADLWQSGWSGKQKVTSKFLGDISKLMNTNSRKQFEIGKAAAIAQVAIDTPKAAMSAYSAMAGIPVVGPALGGVAAAVAIATGVAQIQNIKSQSFGGGGGVGGGIGAAGGAGAAGAAEAQEAAPSNVVDATFVLQGEGGFSGDQIRSVASGLNDFIEDGGQIRSVNVV